MTSSPYSQLLERIRLPDPTLQRLAVAALFSKIRSSPAPISSAARDAIERCLRSSSATADQAVRELCRLAFARDSGILSPQEALVELHAALEGCDQQLVPVFVKAIGFLARFTFRSDKDWGRRFDRSPELHPFIKVLSCRLEVQDELSQQVLLFITHCKSVGMDEVSKFLRPFLLFAIIQKPFSASSSSFARDLISSLASLSCLLPNEAVSIIRLLTECLKYFPRISEQEFKHFLSSAEPLVEAFLVVLKQIIGAEVQLTSNVQACCVELLESLLSVCHDSQKPRGGIDIVLKLSRHLLVAQKELGLHYLPEYSIVTLSMTVILTQVEFEHEHLSILKLLIFLVEWKTENEYGTRRPACYLSEELLFVFPVITLLSSPSMSVKAAASYLLSAVEGFLSDMPVAPMKVQNSDSGFLTISKPESILFMLLNHLWFQEQSPFFHFFCGFMREDMSLVKGTNSGQRHWASGDHSSSIIDRLKRSPVSLHNDNRLAGMSLSMSSVASILVLHPTLGPSAIDSLTAMGFVEPKLAMPLLLSTLFYNKLLCSREGNSPGLLLSLLEMLSSLAVHPVMVPLIVQTFKPMLNKDAKPVLFAAAVRLLCKTWVITDRAFGALQAILDYKSFSEFISERDICISLAASVCDVCRHNPDRGVDLILSVSSSIESRDSTVQALGLESLAHLCEADVVDFYAAWNVIGKHVLDYSVDPVAANGLCTLLRWGALDAETYPEASRNVIRILWAVGTSGSTCSGPLWVKARASAFKSLFYFEVLRVQEAIPDFRRRNFEILVSEDNVEVLKAMEKLEQKIINLEHINRRRGRKEKRIAVHKVEKLLDVLPQVMFPPGKEKVSELPGAALLSLGFSSKSLHILDVAKDLLKLQKTYENTLVEIAESLHVSRNIFLALITLQSWKPFICHWMGVFILYGEAKGSSIDLDTSIKAANSILKVMCTVAADAIPRVAVNIALAIGALCMTLPSSVHMVVAAASEFLLKWLLEYEHEHQQWAAAISLGLISNCFHATDRRRKAEVIGELLKVLCNSNSHLVKGACGVGLGFASWGLLARVEVDDYPIVEERTTRQTEATLLSDIIRTLSLMISQLCPSKCGSLKSFVECFPLGGGTTDGEAASNLPHTGDYNLEEDAWGAAGLVLGLGNSVAAMYRFGAVAAVLKLKDMLISWIPQVNSSLHISPTPVGLVEVALSIGSCLALPIVVDFCQRYELMDNDLDTLLRGYCSLISELLNSNKCGTLYQDLLTASCIGIGTFVSCILRDGVHSMRYDDVKHMLEILRDTYMDTYPPAVHLAGMLGVVNALGACAGDLTCQRNSLQINYEQKESSFIRGPLLSNPICEPLLTSMIQEMFLIAKDAKHQQSRSNAAWALSFLRNRWWSKEIQDVNNSQDSSTHPGPSTQSIDVDSLVSKLCLWLRGVNCSETGEVVHAITIATVLRCLSNAPRLPALDWGPIIRRIMRYEAQLYQKMHVDQAPNSLREECISFSLTHASTSTPLLLFLDELTDLSRFRTLEIHLQLLLLNRLSDLSKIFSGLRLEKLYEDLVEYFISSASPYTFYDLNQKRSLRISFWNGLYQCLNKASNELVPLANVEKCMECLFFLLPVPTYDESTGREVPSSEQEWSEAIRCLALAQEDWLMRVLQIPDSNSFLRESNAVEAATRVTARARLVKAGCIQVAELGKLRAFILNGQSGGIWWSVLVEVAATVSISEASLKGRWLLDALEISCISEYPSTALRFIGLVASICSKYAPLLIINPSIVLSDLPVTLPSLLTESSWISMAESLVDKLWASTARICAWVSCIDSGGRVTGQDKIDESEAEISAFLARVLHKTCVCLKDYLPFEKQLRLANLSVP